jgi:TonB family protein
VNGARTLDGSDKREPFSEATQTVLVFPHGAVIRIATPLAPGQLVFLTNEKSKKEVVCQVVKSKTGGSANGYVELQFTEPSPAFWGLRLPGTVAPPPANAPAVPRAAVTVPSPATKPPLPPAAQVSALPKPPIAPPPPPAPIAEPPTPAPRSVVLPSVPKSLEPAPTESAAPVETIARAPLVSIPPPSPLSSEQHASSPKEALKPLSPPPAAPQRDYSKDIESLFSVPQAHASAPPKPAAPVIPPPPPAPVASSPSTEELKQQAARLQEKLSAMLFTEAPPASLKPPAPPAEFKAETPVAEVANKLFEIAQTEPKPATPPEPKLESKPAIKPATAPSIPVFSTLNAKDEEVAIPSWLRPLSHHADTVMDAPAAVSESVPVAPADPSATVETDAADSPRSEASVFGGQLLGGDTSDVAPAPGPKKGLFMGLAAAVVLLAGGGAWYYTTQMRPPAAGTSPAGQSSAPAAPQESQAVAASNPPLSTSTTPSRAVNNTPPPAVAAPANPAPARNSAPTVPAPSESRNNSPAAARSTAPEPEPPKKPSLGDVRLATPVVHGSSRATASSEALPSIDTPTVSSGTDALAAVSHAKGPAAPLPVGGDVKPAQLVKSVPPAYPPIAKSQHISGNVTLDALIDASGNVAELKVISGPPLLHRAALDAVKQWKYSAAQLDGSPTSMHLTVTVQFRAQ